MRENHSTSHSGPELSILARLILPEHKVEAEPFEELRGLADSAGTTVVGELIQNDDGHHACRRNRVRGRPRSQRGRPFRSRHPRLARFRGRFFRRLGLLVPGLSWFLGGLEKVRSRPSRRQPLRRRPNATPVASTSGEVLMTKSSHVVDLAKDPFRGRIPTSPQKDASVSHCLFLTSTQRIIHGVIQLSVFLLAVVATAQGPSPITSVTSPQVTASQVTAPKTTIPSIAFDAGANGAAVLRTQQQWQRDTVVLPATPIPALGFLCTVGIRRDNKPGYVPVDITFTPTGTFTADRSFTLIIEQVREGGTPPGNALRINLPLVVPQGSTTMTFHRVIPSYRYGAGIRLILQEDGVTLPECETLLRSALPPNQTILIHQAVREIRAPEILVLHPPGPATQRALPDASNRPMPPESDLFQLAVEPRKTPNGQSLSIGLRQTVEPAEKRWVEADTADVPMDWRAYQRFDAVVVRHETLVAIQSNRPTLIQTIRDWVLVGGRLVVVGANDKSEVQDLLGVSGTDVQNLRTNSRTQKTGRTSYESNPKQYFIELRERIEDLRTPTVRRWSVLAPIEPSNFVALISAGVHDGTISLPLRSPTPPGNTIVQAPNSGFSAGTIIMRGGEIGFQGTLIQPDAVVRDASGTPIDFPADILESIDQMAQAADDLESQFKSAPAPWMLQVGSGRVIGIAFDRTDYYWINPFWAYAERAITDPLSNPMVRRGVDPILGDRRFHRWMIPGIAQPPVYAFIGLLAVFVVLVGPAAYWWTGKTGRLYLMFVIAPILAFFTTGAMLLYSVFADGFGTVARIRQITFVDGSSGDAGQRIRATYFAGIRPTNGLPFPVGAEVMPYRDSLDNTWESRMSEPSGNRPAITMSAQSQRFDASFLPSRDQRQFVLHRPIANFGTLSLSVDDDTGQRFLSSSMKVPLHNVIIRDREGIQGSYWLAKFVGVDQPPTLCTAIDDRLAAKLLGQARQKQLLLTNLSLDDSPLYRSRSAVTKDLLASYASNQRISLISDGSFEASLEQALLYSSELPNGSFMATSDVTADAVWVPETEMVESIHYVMGSLQ